MIAIVGLGNSGPRYKKMRHNIGFMAVDELASRQGFSDWEKDQKLKAKVCTGEIAGKKVFLAKPTTMMNNSGEAVKNLMSNIQYPISDPSDLWLIHDEIDLPLGKIKIVRNRGSAGHKGVESVINHLKTDDFVRFRIGIQPRDPHQKPKTQREVSHFVLSPFAPQEENLKNQALKKTQQAIIFALEEGIEKAMAKYNK